MKAELLPTDEALDLLLRAGGVEHLRESPPAAALEAVERCGRLPLALDMAGGIIRTLGRGWEEELLPCLREEVAGASIEQRIVAASLRVIEPALRDEVVAAFTVFAVFPEDALVPVEAIDALGPLIVAATAGVADGSGSRRPSRLLLRKWVQALLGGSLLRGSIDDGVSAHDLIRDVMQQRAAQLTGGVRALQVPPSARMLVSCIA